MIDWQSNTSSSAIASTEAKMRDIWIWNLLKLKDYYA